MKAHTTGTASELFAAKADRHAAGVREHPTAGAEVGAPAPDFAGELARAFVPESAASATVPVPAAMTRQIDPVATPADGGSHESAPVADEPSQTKAPSAPLSRPVPSARSSHPAPSAPDSRPVLSARSSRPAPPAPDSRPVLSAPPSRPAPPASLSRPVLSAPDSRPVLSASPSRPAPSVPPSPPVPSASPPVRGRGLGRGQTLQVRRPSSPASPRPDPSGPQAFEPPRVKTRSGRTRSHRPRSPRPRRAPRRSRSRSWPPRSPPNHEPIAFVNREPVDSQRTPEPNSSSAEATAPPAIPFDSVPVDVAAPVRAHELAPAAEHALPTASPAPRAASPVPAHLDPPASARVAPAASAPVPPAESAPAAPAAPAPVAPAESAPIAPADRSLVAPATSPPATAPVAADRPHASLEPQPLRHVTARPLPRAPLSTNAPIPNHAGRTLDTAKLAASHEPDSHPVTATSTPVGRPLTVEHEPPNVANEATTVAHEPATESVPTEQAPSQADAPHASRAAAHNPSVERPATVERESTNEVGPDPQARPVDETPVLIAPPRVVAASVTAPLPLAPAPLPLAPRPCILVPRPPIRRRVPVAAAGRELSTSAQQILRDAPSNSRAAAIVRGHSARASYSREQPAMDPQPAIAPRSSHVEAAPPRTADFAPSAANIPTTIVAGSAVATADVGPAPVLFSPTVVGAPPAASDPLLPSAGEGQGEGRPCEWRRPPIGGPPHPNPLPRGPGRGKEGTEIEDHKVDWGRDHADCDSAVITPTGTPQ